MTQYDEGFDWETAPDHYKVVCKVCDKVITQCRCVNPNKTVIIAICDDCEKEPGYGHGV